MTRRATFVLPLLVLAAAPARAQDNPSFNLANRGTQPITEAYASPAGVTNWGRNRLVNGPIPPGNKFAIRLPADGNCIYDIRVVYANGTADERRNTNTCTVDDVTFPGGRPERGGNAGRQQQASDDPSFRLINRGRSEITEVYASPTGDDDWGRDRLGDETVAAGAQRVIRLPPGQCSYDVRVVYASGEATERRRLNLCTITELRFP